MQNDKCIVMCNVNQVNKCKVQFHITIFLNINNFEFKDMKELKNLELLR